MNREDIIRTAREANIATDFGRLGYPYLPELTRFAALVAAHEREMCAEMCEDLSGKWDSWFVVKGDKFDRGLSVGARDCADLIRQRGDQ